MTSNTVQLVCIPLPHLDTELNYDSGIRCQGDVEVLVCTLSDVSTLFKHFQNTATSTTEKETEPSCQL